MSYREHLLKRPSQLQVPGVEGVFTAEDVPGHNDTGAVVHDEELFATKEVVCIGQPLGIVVAATEVAARRGAAAVKVVYEDLPVIVSIDEAIAAGSFFEVRAATTMLICSCIGATGHGEM